MENRNDRNKNGKRTPQSLNKNRPVRGNADRPADRERPSYNGERRTAPVNRDSQVNLRKNTAEGRSERVNPRPVAKKKKKVPFWKKIKPKFIIALIAIIAIIIAVISISPKEPDCYEISRSSITIYENMQGVLIKKETGYKYPQDSTVISRVNEGTYVQSGDVVATVKMIDFQDDLYEKLNLARAATIKYMLDKMDNDIIEAAVDNIDLEIKNVSTKMLDTIAVDPSKYTEYSEQIKLLFEQKKELVLAEFGVDVKINDYLNDEERIISSMQAQIQNITAKEAGIISYNTDGYGNVYNWKNIDNITKTDIQEILDDEISGSLENSMKESDFFISDMEENYILLYDKDNKLKYLSEDEEVIININGKIDSLAMVKKITKEDGESLIVTEPKGTLVELYRERVLDIKLQKTWNGLVIPKEHIVDKKNNLGVYVYENGEKRFVKVNILVEDKDVVIVDTNAIDNEIKIGMMIVKQSKK